MFNKIKKALKKPANALMTMGVAMVVVGCVMELFV